MVRSENYTGACRRVVWQVIRRPAHSLAVAEPPARWPPDYEIEHHVAYLVREAAGLACAWGIQEQDDDCLHFLAEAIAQQLGQ